MAILVGTSGWVYPHWRGRFYPEDLSPSKWLSYFSQRFPTVEVNNTFYRLPQASTFAAWKQQSAEDFVITVKGSRYITHIKRLLRFRPRSEAASGIPGYDALFAAKSDIGGILDVEGKKMEGRFVRGPVDSRLDRFTVIFAKHCVSYLDRVAVKLDIALSGFTVALDAMDDEPGIA